MTLGKPGVKYGLHRPGAKPTAKPVASIFGDADEEAEEQMNVGKVLTSDKHREKMQKRAAVMSPSPWKSLRRSLATQRPSSA